MGYVDLLTEEQVKPARRSAAASSTFKIGLLVDSTSASKYVFEFAQWALSQPHLSVALIIHKSPSANWNMTLSGRVRKLFGTLCKDGFSFALSKVLFRLVVAIEAASLRFTRSHKDHKRKLDLSSIASEAITISPIVSKSGFVYRFTPADIQRVKDLHCDVLIRCGNGILRGDILNAAEHGILSFHHADNRINRGGPPGFWEVYYRQDTTGFTIQRLTEELDGGMVLMRGHFPTKYYYQLNQALLFERSNYYLQAVIQETALRGQLPPVLPSLPYAQQLYRSPGTGQILLYSLRVLARFVAKSLGVLASYRLRWNVAFLRSDWRDAVLWRAVEIKNPPFHYLADPFTITRNGRDYCFVEDFDYRTQRGSIAVYELREKAAIRLGTALAEDFHLSFPYLFEYEGALFMCPECSESKEIRIYRCLEFPLRWELEKVVMRNVNAVDTVIFEKGGKWWMLTNIDPVGNGDYRSELFAFHAASPFDEWVAHPLNPIIIDASCAGNGGLINEGERIFRIAQTQGFDFYGKASTINEVLELTEHTYREASISKITPTFKSGICGTHHLHSNGKVTVFDYVRRSWIRK